MGPEMEGRDEGTSFWKDKTCVTSESPGSRNSWESLQVIGLGIMIQSF